MKFLINTKEKNIIQKQKSYLFKSTLSYIGSKYRLLNFLNEEITKICGNLENKIFCDLFSGTGNVGIFFKNKNAQIISNDIEYFSFVINKNYIENDVIFNYEEKLDFLNKIDGENGFIFQEYSLGGNGNRIYFSGENGKKIDAIRNSIQNWFVNDEISKNEYFFYLTSLLEATDKVANTASVYGAFLKKIKKTAETPLILKSPLFQNNNKGIVYNEEASLLINKIKGDILYLDPPYNSRQYGSNYHILNTIALYDKFEPKGKTGLRPYFKSKFSSKRKAKEALQYLIKNANFKYIFLSYNNEGIIPLQEIENMMKNEGCYSQVSIKHNRFKADKKREYKSNFTIEYLHILEK